jgi:sugar phosphate isomerase/epimerase
MSQQDLFFAYRHLGFTKYEAFSGWAKCRHEWTGDAEADRQCAANFGLEITSYHLPPITEDIEASLGHAMAAARYASRLGVKIVLFKAVKKELFGLVGKRFLDAIEKENLPITAVLQNHAGSAISTLQDYRDVFAMLDHDPRIKAILEVGHFQRVGIHWREGWNLLEGRIALIHVNEIRNGKSVPYGSGEVDFSGLLAQVKTSGYAGDIVVELELETHEHDPRTTLDGLGQTIDFLTQLYNKA